MTHAQLEAVLVEGRVGVNASDLHGSVTGYLCGHGAGDARGLLDALQLECASGPAGERVRSCVQEVCRDCREALDDPGMGFEPLLPATEFPLPERADALVEWCRGFLGGFGLAGADAAALPEDGSEVLHDFATIAASQLDCGDNDDDERSLMEVSEFVRVGVLLLHAEVAGSKAARAPDSGSRVH